MNGQLFVAYLAVAVLLCWALVGSKGYWAVKACLIVSSLSLALYVWTLAADRPGWPTREHLPAQGAFVYCLVADDNSAIYIWLVPSNGVEPRAYRIDYSEQLHRACIAGKQATSRAGGLVAFRHGRQGAKGHAPGRWVFYRLPPPKPPKKEHR